MAHYKRIKRKEDLSQPDEFVSFWDRVLFWMHENSEKLMYATFGLILVFLMAGGVWYYDNSREANAQKDLYFAIDSFPREDGEVKPGNGDEFIAKMDELSKRYAGTVGGRMAAVYKGNGLYELNRLDEALEVYKKVVGGGGKEDTITRLAAIGMARIFQDRERYQESNDTLEPYRKVEAAPFGEEMDLMVAMNNEMMGNPQAALEVYQSFLDKYRDSVRREQAEEAAGRLSKHLGS